MDTTEDREKGVCEAFLEWSGLLMEARMEEDDGLIMEDRGAIENDGEEVDYYDEDYDLDEDIMEEEAEDEEEMELLERYRHAIGPDLSGRITEEDEEFLKWNYGFMSLHNENMVCQHDFKIYEYSGFSRGDVVIIRKLGTRDGFYSRKRSLIGKRALILALETLYQDGYMGCYLRILEGNHVGRRHRFILVKLEHPVGNDPIPKGTKVNSLCRGS